MVRVLLLAPRSLKLAFPSLDIFIRPSTRLVSPPLVLATTFTAVGARTIGGHGPWWVCLIEVGRIHKCSQVFRDDGLELLLEHVIDGAPEHADAGCQTTCNVVFRDSGHGLRGGG